MDAGKTMQMDAGLRKALQAAVAELNRELEQLDQQVRSALSRGDVATAARLSIEMDLVGKRIDFARRRLA